MSADRGMPMTIVERARRLMAACPAAISGQGGHAATFRVACGLVWGFGLSPEEAMPLMMEYNSASCSPPWREHELWHKLRSALSTNHTQARGHLLEEWGAVRGVLPVYEAPRKRAAVVYDAEALRRAQRADWVVDEAFLRARSAYDPKRVSFGQVLDLLYGPEDKVMVFGSMKSRGDWMRWRGGWYALGKVPNEKAVPARALPERTDEGMVWLIQPVDGKWHAVTGKVTLSRRTRASVTRYPHVLLESDEAPHGLWLNALVQMRLPIVAIVASGGRSLHALLRVDAGSLEEWKECVAAVRDVLAALGCDSQALGNPTVNMRAPGCLRVGKCRDKKFTPFPGGPVKQRLLYLNPGAAAVALGELPVREHGD